MEVVGVKSDLKGNREDLQWFQALVPVCHMALDRNFCGLRYCLGVVSGYSDEDLSLEKKIFLNTWDIGGSKD